LGRLLDSAVPSENSRVPVCLVFVADGRAVHAAVPKLASPPTRQQPRRGAKSEAAAKLKEEADVQEESDSGWQEDSSQEGAAGQRLGRGVAAAPRVAAGTPGKADAKQQVVLGDNKAFDAMAHSDFENASLGTPGPSPGAAAWQQTVGGAAAGAAAGAHALRAATDDEEPSQQPSRQHKQQQQQRKQANARQAGGSLSPGQENRGATNGGRTLQRGAKAAVAAKPGAGKTVSKGAKAHRKRARA
jgi:hypothetical protein